MPSHRICPSTTGTAEEARREEERSEEEGGRGGEVSSGQRQDHQNSLQHQLGSQEEDDWV